MADDKSRALKSDVLTLPNLLSLFRILLVPVFVWSMVSHRSLEALLIFFLAGLTDVLDGFTARLWHQRSKIGTILDPAGDKLLLVASYIVLSLPALASPNVVPLWLTLVVFARDLLIVTGAFIAYLSWKQTTFAPSLLGKISTICQVGTVFLVLLLNFLRTAPWGMRGVFYLTLLVTLASGIHYFVFGLKMLSARGQV